MAEATMEDGTEPASDSAPVTIPGALPGPHSASTPDLDRAVRIVAFLFSAALLALPFLVVEFPPVGDLPQHAAQIRLAADALTNPQSVYELRWWVPYSFAYLVLGGAMFVLGPVAGAKFGAYLIATTWVGAIHLLAAVRRRPVESAMVASLFVLGCGFYWGFVSFLVALLPLSLFVLLAYGTWERPLSRYDILRWLGLELWLWSTHLLAVVMGLGWLGLLLIRRRRMGSLALQRLAMSTPLVIASAAFYPTLKSRAFQGPPHWFQLPTSRLSSQWVGDYALGGFHGEFERVVLFGVLAWALLGVAQARRKGGQERFDAPLSAAGGVFLAAAFLLPDQVDNTILFATRWLAPGIAFVVLSAPPPSLGRAGGAVAPLLALAMAMGTSFAWARFEAVDLDGLSAAVHAIEDRPRVLGLATRRESELMRGRPFLQTFAWAQVVHGGSLNFSFAEFGPFPVVFRRPFTPPWTPGLEWFPERVVASDFAHFDYAIVSGDRETHRRLMQRYGLRPVSRPGVWRAYRIVPDALNRSEAGP